MTVSTHDSLAGGGLFGHVKSAVIQKWCNVLVWTHEILAEGVPQFYTQNHAVQTRYAALAEAQLKTVM